MAKPVAMAVQFHDLQDAANPLDGVEIIDSVVLDRVLVLPSNRRPFVCTLTDRDARELTCAIGEGIGSVQFSGGQGAPFWMAVAPGAGARPQSTGELYAGAPEFLCGGTPTPIPVRYCLSMDTVRRIARQFLERADRYDGVRWESI